MTPTEYIQTKLEALKQPLNLVRLTDQDQLVEDVFKALMSKKFRKYSVAPDPVQHIQSSVKANIEKNEPIKFTMPFGAYKLWRLEETPEPDWAELFSMMYFTKWLKPICKIYEPGVWFDFFSDDVIIPRLNNVPADDLKDYNRVFHELLDFMKPYQPGNLKMTITRVIDRYDNQEDFEAEFQQQFKELTAKLDGGLPELDDTAKATIELNVKTTLEQEKDPHWREKVQLIHDSYSVVSKRRPYYRSPEAHKIMVLTSPLWGMLAVGSTKDSIMKFWVGAGVLRPSGDDYRQLIYSPKQLDESTFKIENTKIDGLNGKNFQSIRVLQ